MFFVLSKILSYLAQPLVIVVILLVSAWVVRNARWKKILYRSGFILLLFTSNYFIANEVMRAWEVPVTTYKSITKTYDFGVLLTGVTKTEMTPKDRVYFGRGADRATHTLQLYKLGIIRKVLVSGGSGRLNGTGVKEADDLADFLKLAGIPEEDIVIENRSKNTHESAVEVSAILKDLGGSKELLLVTSGYHMRRSLACFKKTGIVIDPFSAEPVSEPRKYQPDKLLIPTLEAMGMWQTMLKEWVGFVAYWLAGYV
ncbi:MAG TPA: YdcF family protein [Cyclobacteriaceae bacterium]|nr:YdcF family protein [Cyclobacteriaceae bacterium]